MAFPSTPTPSCPHRIGSASRSSHVDTTNAASVYTDDEWVTVLDPRHPLHGKKFRVAWRPEGAVCKRTDILVFYRGDDRLRIPAAALEAPKIGQRVGTKLTCAAVEELVLVAKACGDRNGSRPTLGKPDGSNEEKNKRRSGVHTKRGDR